MFLLKGHGTHAVTSGDMGPYKEGKAMSASAACGYPFGQYPSNPREGDFGYYFEGADTLQGDPIDITSALDALADATINAHPKPRENSSMPPIFTYMGQFIDHDITANTDRETGLSVIDTEVVEPLPQATVKAKLGNLRFASLGLDSVYGDNPEQGPIAKMLQSNLRWHGDRAKMEGGLDDDATHLGGLDQGAVNDPNVAELPKDAMRDLLRAGHASTHDEFDVDLLLTGGPEVTDLFFQNGMLNRRRAIIGDARNDENLAVAQFHLAMLRLHNEVVDAAPGDVVAQGRNAVFKWAQKTTRWIYQWLVINEYLPAICDRGILDQVNQNGPVLYNALIRAHGLKDPDLLPMPLEFSVAAFRFGHSMARESYDWNRIFELDPADPNSGASFALLQFFTGDAMPTDRLPANWPIAWDRFLHGPTKAKPFRSARKIDTQLNLTLGDMPNVNPGDHGVLRHLARRNMRRAYRLAIPTAQGCLDALSANFGINLDRLSPDDLLSGHTKDAVKDGNFQEATPLWFYVLKEAELLADGDSLGPLGSMIVADTIIGLIRKDANSYHNAAGAGWEPKDSVQPNGVDITDMASMMAAAGLA